MSKESKEIERRMLIKKTQAEIRKFVETLDNQQEKYIELAKEAKLKGADSQYKLALNGLKACMIQKKKADEMSLNIELASQMRDLTKMTASFLGAMQSISKDMIKTTKSMDFLNVEKEFGTAMNDVEMSTEKLDVLLDTSTSSYDSMFSGSQSKDIEKMVSEESKSEESSLDKDIDSKIDEIKKSLEKA